MLPALRGANKVCLKRCIVVHYLVPPLLPEPDLPGLC